MNTEHALQLTEERIHDLGYLLAEFALEFVPRGDNARNYEANDFLALFDDWYFNFIRYAETNRMLAMGERETLVENDNELDCIIKDAAIDAAREILAVRK